MGDEAITSRQVEELAGVVPSSELKEMTRAIATKNVDTIIEYVKEFMKNGWSAVAVVNQLHDYYIKNDQFDSNFKNKVSWILYDTDSKLTNGTNEHIQLLNLLIKISRPYNNLLIHDNFRVFTTLRLPIVDKQRGAPSFIFLGLLESVILIEKRMAIV